MASGLCDVFYYSLKSGKKTKPKTEALQDPKTVPSGRTPAHILSLCALFWPRGAGPREE